MAMVDMAMEAMASVRLSLVMDMEVTAMSTEPLRDLPEVMEVIVITTRGLLNLVMDIVAEATTIEVHKEFKDMAMAVITRGLLMLDTTMVMVNLMSTRAVLIITDLMAMKLIMSIKRDLLLLKLLVMVVLV